MSEEQALQEIQLSITMELLRDPELLGSEMQRALAMRDPRHLETHVFHMKERGCIWRTVTLVVAYTQEVPETLHYSFLSTASPDPGGGELKGIVRSASISFPVRSVGHEWSAYREDVRNIILVNGIFHGSGEAVLLNWRNQYGPNSSLGVWARVTPDLLGRLGILWEWHTLFDLGGEGGVGVQVGRYRPRLPRPAPPTSGHFPACGYV